MPKLSLSKLTFSLFILLIILNTNVLLSQNSSNNKTKKSKKDHVLLIQSLDLKIGLATQLNTDEKKFKFLPEFGIGRRINISVNDMRFSADFLFGTEFMFDPSLIYGFKLTPSIMIFNYSLAFTFIYYTDFKKGNFKIRPELGWNKGNFRVALGYNIPTYNNDAFTNLKDADIQLTVSYYLPLKDIFKIEVKH